MKNDRKILFFDIDGTLLTPPPYSIPKSAKTALTKAREKGHLVFINSGRTLAMIPSLVRELAFDGYVCGCGSQIYLEGQLLHSSSVPNTLCRETVQVLRDCRIAAFFECCDRILYDGLSGIRASSVEHMKKTVAAEDLSAYGQEREHSYTFDKFLVFLQPDSDDKTFRKFCEKHFACFDHGGRILEVTQKDCSKATGIRFLLDYLHLPRENSYAFGDSTNDLPMLEYAGTSVAMGNAVSEILPYCTYRTTDINDDGIYHALSYFGLM